MERFFEGVIRHKNRILALFVVLILVSAACKPLIRVNYDMNSYLPKDAASSVALDVMEQEFDGAIPNARVMVKDVTIPEALEMKARIAAIPGVTDVTWLDDNVSLTVPLEMLDAYTVEASYVDSNALFTVTVDNEHTTEAVNGIRDLLGERGALTGSAVSTVLAQETTVKEVRTITVLSIAIGLFILLLTTTSWIQPLLILAGLGTAVILNGGSNLIFGEVSFVTNAAGSILQLAVSLDYSVFLVHRFEECRLMDSNPVTAMRTALCKSVSSIAASGLTTVIGFLALCLMRFGIGPDLGMALAKGIGISLITVFLFMPGFLLTTLPLIDKTRHKPLLPPFDGFGKAVSKVTVAIACCFVLIALPAYLASNHNDYYFGSSHIFSEGTPYGDDTAEIREVFGKGDTYVMLVPRGDTATEKLLVDQLKQLEPVTGIIAFVEQAGPEVPYEYLDADTLRKLESDHYSRMVISVAADYEGPETTALIESIRGLGQQYYGDAYYLAGEGVSTLDQKHTVMADMIKVNLAAIGAVFMVLLITMRSPVLPVILVLTIEAAIWINLAVPYFMDSSIFYIAYLIISSIQLGATVDYAILMSDRYRENRQSLSRDTAVWRTVSDVTVSIITSGVVLSFCGFLMGTISSHGVLSQLGILLGRGTICSLLAVLFVLPGLLRITDRFFVRRGPDETGEEVS